MTLVLIRAALWLFWTANRHSRPAGRQPRLMEQLTRRDLAAFSARASTPARPHRPG
ncbi:hypothetical protein [Streptomyces sp. NPDC050585]|uniref:hypothetical protein n=1 Tax=Streptomyces sp. NPDC050585 TaxID=3365632 RepID=UPI0037A4B5FA